VESKTKVFCWHHSGESRLQYYLSHNMVDCPSEGYLAKHELKPGDQIRISVKVRNQPRGRILAVAKLVSRTPYHLIHPRHKRYPYGVDLRNVTLSLRSRLEKRDITERDSTLYAIPSCETSTNEPEPLGVGYANASSRTP